ncbi:MAG: hypothetical protein K2I51_06185, partial [Muribaculaceae bacterium]|nr:hypothetical protein [Muribaculaceae bacterium]
MKKFVLSAAALLTLCAANAQGALDMRSKARLRQLKLEQKQADTPARMLLGGAKANNADNAESQKYVGAFVTMAPGATA